MSNSGNPKSSWWKDALLAAGCLLLVLGLVFRESFEPEKVVFANDAPLGAIAAHAFDESHGWSHWQDLNWVGGEFPSAMPNFTKGFFELCMVLGEKPVDASALTGPVLFAKFYQPASLVLLGICAWLFFRSLKFRQPVCILGALALALNGDLFSYTTWGLPSGALGAAGALLAMAAVVRGLRETGWRMLAWVILGGLALGQGVMEGYDVGGIFSLYVALFVLVAALNREGVGKKTVLPAFAWGGAMVVVVAAAAALMAGHALSNLMRTEGGAAARAKAGTTDRVEGLEKSFAVQLAAIQADPRYPPAQKQQVIAQLHEQKEEILTIWRERPFDQATQWSVPPLESVRMAVPGMFGYRENPHGWMMHSVEPGQQYWGRVGQWPAFTRLQAKHPKWATAWAKYKEKYRTHTPPLMRHGSSGIYMGLLVLIVALWALLQACRGGNSVFGPLERRWVFFWTVVALGSLVLAWGHHTPLYGLIYKLPFFNIIRNPIKFMHVCGLAMGILFAYGLQGMARTYVAGREREGDMGEQFRHWLRTLAGWEKKWAMVMLGMMVLGVLGWIGYAAMKEELMDYLISAERFSKEMAIPMAEGSLKSAGMAVLFLAVALAGLTVLISGVVRERHALFLWVGLGTVLVVDLTVGSGPHLVHYDFRQKYASNQVVDLLRQRPFEQRVRHAGEMVSEELRVLHGEKLQLAQQFRQTTDPVIQQQMIQRDREIDSLMKVIQVFHGNYHTDWKQALFPFYRVQAMDIIQDPRPDPMNTDYREALMSQLADPLRLWELTGTKFWLGNTFVTAKDMDAKLGTTNQFTVHTRFDIVPITGQSNAYTALVSEQGKLAVLEFDRALPRAGVYVNWRSGMTDEKTLEILPDPGWDPHREVLIAEKIPDPENADANSSVMPVRYLSYDPQRIVLETDAATATVLLLNDKHHPGWKVTVDGKSARLLRANYLMRGVHLPAGKHKVEFLFAPEEGSIYVSLSGFGLGLAAFLALLFLPKPPKLESKDEEIVEVPEEETKGRSADPETPTADETSSPDAPPKPSRRKSRSRSGRRKKR